MRGPADVLLQGSKIIGVGDIESAFSPDLDLSELTLLPGLLDSHVHLSFGGDSEDVVGDLARTSDRELRQLVRTRAANAAHRGVTSLRDLGDRAFVALELGQSPGRETFPDLPTVVSSGPPITSPGGHCHYLGGEVDGLGEALSLVHAHAARGVEWIKVMVTGGVLTSGERPLDLQFATDDLKAIVETAHDLGLPIAGHAHTAPGIEACCAAGFDTIEHCTFGTATEFVYDGGVADQLARSMVSVCPTFVERPGVEWDAERIAWRRQVLDELARRGVELIVGTDAGVIEGLGHDSLPWAVLSTCAAGIDPVAVLRSATILAAKACSLGESKGALEPGLDADIVGVRGNPLVSPDVLLDPEVVVVRGTVLSP